MAVDPKHPLAPFVDNNPNPTTFRMPIRPSLSQHVAENGLMAGLASHETAMQEYDRQLEANINEQLKSIPALPVGKQV